MKKRASYIYYALCLFCGLVLNDANTPFLTSMIQITVAGVVAILIDAAITKIQQIEIKKI